MQEEIAKPTTVLQCHPRWFEREVVEKGRRYERLDLGTYRVRDWPQSEIVLDHRLPPEGFYAT